MTMRTDASAPLPLRRRLGAAAAVVLAMHLLLFIGLWHTLRQRQVDVQPEIRSLVWVKPTEAPAPPLELRQDKPRRSVDQPWQHPPPPSAAPRASTWVQPAPAAPAAITTPAPTAAASAPPAERLLDGTATRAALRQTGRLPLLQERAAAATGIPIERTDTALAQQVAEAGIPDCMKDAEAASGQIGPIGLGGILGLPFLAARVASGKCAK